MISECITHDQILRGILAAGLCRGAGIRPGWVHCAPPVMQSSFPRALAWHLETHHSVTRLWDYEDWCFFGAAMHFLACLGLPCGWRSPRETNIREVNHLHASLSTQPGSTLWNLAVPIGFWADIHLLNRSFKYKNTPFLFFHPSVFKWWS